MATAALDPETQARLLLAQRSEITEYFIYEKLARSVKDPHNRGILRHISRDELKHHNIWKGYTGKNVQPDRWKMWLYYFIARVLGITFGLKLMERGEGEAQINYGEIAKYVQAAEAISRDENEYEKKLLGLIDEERLHYIGAVVRGLNEGLVELTGAMAGLTFAFQNSGLIATTGLIIGLAMSLSLGGTPSIWQPNQRRADSIPSTRLPIPGSPISLPSCCWSSPTWCSTTFIPPWA